MECIMDFEQLKEKASSLPLAPGVYIMRDKQGQVIYVGKAKKLKNRVSQYFQDTASHSLKTRLMVSKIDHFDVIVAASEFEALVLECSLIKRHMPKYNILLKDDKTYPWIVIRREPFARVLSTRQLVRDGSEYFGPYGSIATQRSLLEFIRRVIPLRTCKLNLTTESIARGKHQLCLQYHLGNCKAPCVGKCSREEYKGFIDIATSVLKGDLRPVRSYLEGEMMRAAEELRFEVAARYKARANRS